MHLIQLRIKNYVLPATAIENQLDGFWNYKWLGMVFWRKEDHIHYSAHLIAHVQSQKHIEKWNVTYSDLQIAMCNVICMQKLEGKTDFIDNSCSFCTNAT